jgi:nucleotide-binding universal stress UspA family protein
MKVLVAYDGTLRSDEALAYGIERAREGKDELIVLHVFNRGLFAGYDAHPFAEHRARQEALGRLAEAGAALKASGVRYRVVEEEGMPGDVTMEFARAEKVDLLICPPRMRGLVKRFKKLMRESGKEATGSEILDDKNRLRLTAAGIKA